MTQILLEQDSFFNIYSIQEFKAVYVEFKGDFDVEKYKYVCQKALDLAVKYNSLAVVSNHLKTTPVPKEAQKWFTIEFCKVIKDKVKDTPNLQLVIINQKKDPLRQNIAQFMGYLFNLMTDLKFHYVHSKEEAWEYLGIS
jgi:tryptophanase